MTLKEKLKKAEMLIDNLDLNIGELIKETSNAKLLVNDVLDHPSQKEENEAIIKRIDEIERTLKGLKEWTQDYFK